MYSESLINDAKMVVKATLSNQLARVSPKLYMKATRETGRGKEEVGADEVAAYFVACVDDYFDQLGVARGDREAYLAGKRILEYGPGDVLGVAFLLHAYGAESVCCVDRFALQQPSALNLGVYQRLLDGLEGAARERGRHAFVVAGDPASGFRVDAVEYRVTKDGLAAGSASYDMIISRAVLEHVNELEMTFRNIASSLCADGISIHQVDLKSHGLDRYQPFDFLTWPNALYRVMFSHKGFPNRWRVDKYRELARKVGLSIDRLVPTGRLTPEQVERIASKVAPQFRGVDADELGWIGFWMTMRLDPSSTKRSA